MAGEFVVQGSFKIVQFQVKAGISKDMILQSSSLKVTRRESMVFLSHQY